MEPIERELHDHKARLKQLDAELKQLEAEKFRASSREQAEHSLEITKRLYEIDSAKAAIRELEQALADKREGHAS